MAETQIPVAEQFYSIQGEGPYAGTPAVFLRLAGCNLQCGHAGDLQDYEQGDEPTKDGASWVCDTIDVWREADATYTPEELREEWLDELFGYAVDVLDAHIVLTGGEPTLPPHQERFVEFYEHLEEIDIEPFVEVETNGTQEITPEFREVVDHFNVSLKLSNSGHSEDERLNDEVIHQYVLEGKENAVFKFVVSSEDDLEEIGRIQKQYGIPCEQVMLMPAGQSKEQLGETYPIVAETCKKQGYKFSPRLHVDIWNQATGV